MLSLDEALDGNNRTAKRLKISTSGQVTSEKEAKKPAAGGFLVRCKDGTEVPVSPEQSLRLQKNCQYFRNVFRLGTTESACGVLSKPDWKEETVRAIVGLIVDGRCEIPHDYKELKVAATHICLALRVCHPINGRNISDEESTVESMSQRWTDHKSEFVLETPLLSSADAVSK